MARTMTTERDVVPRRQRPAASRGADSVPRSRRGVLPRRSCGVSLRSTRCLPPRTANATSETQAKAEEEEPLQMKGLQEQHAAELERALEERTAELNENLSAEKAAALLAEFNRMMEENLAEQKAQLQ